MNRLTKTFRVIVCGVAFVLYAAMPAIADDIEIYTSLGSSAVSVQPNILFILDTSGSMNAKVTVTQKSYDSKKTYSGCYRAGRIYYSTSGSAPSCRSSRYFYDSALHCDHAWDEYDASGVKIDPDGPLDTAGFYTGQVAQKRKNNVWSTIRIRRSSDRSRPVECKQDQGIHGSNSAPTPRTYIANTSNGWQSSPTNPSVWSNGGSNYTLYHWNYLNYLQDPSANTSSTRFKEMQKAILAITNANSNINIGLMQYDSRYAQGGPVIYAMEDINAARNDFQARVKNMSAGGATPLAETYWEALRYFGGRTIEYGRTSSPPTQTAAKENGNPNYYQTPITETCQKNTIVYLTDGAPTYDHLSTAQINDLPGFPSSKKFCADNGSTYNYYSDANTSCLEFMAGWAADQDVAFRSDVPAHAGEQNITTYTIGFDFSSGSRSEREAADLLKRTAAAGGGKFFEAKDAASLSSVFNQIIAQVLAVNTTFSSPAVSVNAFNRATHLDDLYFTLFKPRIGSHWDGNLKKYKIAFDSSGAPIIVDVNGADAIDPINGFFASGATSFWTDSSDAPDGDEAKKGGAAGELTVARNVYTFTGSYTDTNGVNVPANTDLTANINALDKSNATITESLLGIVGKSPVIGSTPYRTSLLDWAYGLDVFDDDKDGSTTDARRIMGDPLHSEPALVQYGEVAGQPELVAYVATNDGYLHAFDTLTGVEYFSFVPQELLSNLNVIFEDNGTQGKSYGLDGNVVPWINDVDGDGKIEPGENVYLYVSMRRGGNNIYSLDVTDKTSPVFRWVIKGGTGDFAELAQTWSTVNVEQMKINGAEKTVLIFGGGYDTNQDVVTTRTVDSTGRAVYIVDAETGKRIWWAGPNGSGADLELAEMQYSIPARIKPLDMDGDGNIDRLYASDMGGQIWRFDMIGDNPIGFIGGRIADLALDGSTTDNRRFYYPPDVSLIYEEGSAPYLAIVAASGYRAHPLNTVIRDRLYMIRDYDIYKAPTTYTTITESDLFDTTDNVIGEGSDSQISAATTALSSAKGWFISFNEPGSGAYIGEKSLSEPLILDGVAIVTTYIPEDLVGLSTGSCTPREGTGSVYFVNITDGTPTYDNNGSIDKTREDRRTFLKRGGIPPSPNIIITDKGTARCVGTECSKSLEINNIQKTYWYEKEQ